MANTRKQLLDLLKLPENSECADCGEPDPEWVSCTLGVFICLQCSGIHRSPSIGKVKSVQLDNWEDDTVQFLKEHGNKKAKEKYEAFVPPFYYRPRARDCMVLKEQWIKAKYEREEFTSDEESPYTTGHKEGNLWKKGRDRKQFLERRFVFSGREKVLKYYINNHADPKGTIPIQSLNATFQAEKIGHAHGLEITYIKDEQTRNLFVYHDEGQEIVTWFNVLRAARFTYLKGAFPAVPEEELIPRITRNYSKAGYMEKTGPRQREAFRKRWFNLDSEERKLLYYKKPLDAFPQGGIFLGSKEQGYRVLEGLPEGTKGNKRDAVIIIKTPDREFKLTCENTTDQKEWLKALTQVISRPTTAQDMDEEKRFRKTHHK
ncbi:arf-GAP with dual PH domain-containing protein 2 isoform X2 [Spea bombifrons]|uniref:arf-GAP with dual PH domain-containing protein 2 isoform X2 n=1 Tax=Spea bombifrons TaxID=233779 RepID=UPI00234948B9|nr:arf-GAP with dual PH domain-containing protein 2 isoform X2 [Spea bombifrons]